MLKYSVAKSSGSEHDPPRHGKTRHDMNQNQVFEGCLGRFGDSTLVVRGSPSAKSDGLTATEDDVQLLVRNVVLLVWVGGTSEETGIL